MRLVLDTNVLFAAYSYRGTCAALYEQALCTETLLTSEAILEELHAVLRDKARVPEAEAVRGRDEVRANAEVVIPVKLLQPVARDPDDDVILATAIAAQADLLVTGDKDLLVLREFQQIPIVTPAECLARLTGKRE